MLKPLYEQPRNSVLDISGLNLKREDTKEPITEIDFHHVDGAYSYCTLIGEPDKVFHLSASAEAKFVKPIETNGHE